LALFWGTITEDARGYFEQLYEKYPVDVSKVLAGVVLTKDATHPTLASWVATAQDQSGNVDMSKTATITVTDVKIVPANPQPGAGFAVTWSVTADKGFQERKDRVQIRNSDGTQVAEQTTPDQKVIGAGASVKGQADIAALPLGSYTAYVVGNVEGGSDGVPNMKGLQVVNAESFFVGQTAESQKVQETLKFGKASNLVYRARETNAERVLDSQSSPPLMGLEERVLDDLADAADDLASINGMTDPLKADLGNLAMWLRTSPRPVIIEKDWTTLRGQLMNLAQITDVDEAGKFATGFIRALQEQRSRMEAF
jgi:hypothetical protein